MCYNGLTPRVRIKEEISHEGLGGRALQQQTPCSGTAGDGRLSIAAPARVSTAEQAVGKQRLLSLLPSLAIFSQASGPLSPCSRLAAHVVS